MIFNKHLELAGRHAVLSPSKYHWMNYDDDKFDRWYMAQLGSARGSEYHEVAQRLIKLREKLPRNKKTVNQYVNDAIGYRMHPEMTLFYSDVAFGTCDAICFRNNLLRVHDLKMGVTRASEKQLYAYVALFCLEYGYKPHNIEIECRIYQNDDFSVYIPDPDEIVHIMDKLVTFTKRTYELREEALS